MTVAGTYEFSVNSPLGQQNGTFTVVPDASETTFSGTLDGTMGSTQVTDGTIVGQMLSWTMNISSPMPMTLECEATVAGDDVSGTVRAGIFGSMPLTGKRVS